MDEEGENENIFELIEVFEEAIRDIRANGDSVSIKDMAYDTKLILRAGFSALFSFAKEESCFDSRSSLMEFVSKSLEFSIKYNIIDE